VDDINVLESFASENNVEILGNNKFMPLWYTLACTKSSAGNALKMANLFYESGKFSAAEPDLMVDDLPQCVDDEYFSDQWNLDNTGQNGGTSGIDIQFCDARGITSGCNDIIVAIVDHGIELDHPDLPNMFSLSYDTESGTQPSQVLGSHGTACAGIIGASADNGDGIAGIASNCRLMSVSNSMVGTPNSRQRRGDGINWAWHNGADVISNSWGSTLQYEIIDDAIDSALTQGRNGLGCVVLFAAGNDNVNAVEYPANSNSDIIAVGAMSPCGQRKSPSSCDGENWGSNYGSTLDVVAPGIFIPTTDIQDTAGYNDDSGTDGNYYLTFNGTSAATPHVAGVAALILSINPDLTQDEVRDIIESTCTKVGSYSYTTTSGRNNGTWNNQTGYGLLNAYAAVLKASGGNISGAGVVCTWNSTFSLTGVTSGLNIDWDCSTSLLTQVGDDNGSSFIVHANSSSTNGQGWISVKIITDCGDTITRTKTVWVGSPGTFDVSDWDKFAINSADGGDWYVCTDQAGNEFDLSYYRTYSMCSNFEIKITNLNNTHTYDQFYSTDGVGDLDYPNLQEGWYLIWVRGYNSCGWGDWTDSELEFIECSLMRLYFSPNPTSGETTVSIGKDATAEITTSTELVFDETAEWELEVYDNAQNLKEKKTNLKGNSAKLQTAGWIEGVYIVRVKYKDEILTGKLIVKK
jgi:hypothetical protein